MATIILREKIYVPVPDADELKDLADEHYVIDLFNEAQCEPCEFRDDRPTDQCQDCANYLARKKLYRTETRPDGQEYMGFPYGQRHLIKEVIPAVVKMGIKDMRPDIPFKTNLKFTGTPRVHQQKAIDHLLGLAESGFGIRGILVAPARSGKTPTSVALACAMKMRTLILVNQHDLGSQFYTTCYGSANQEALTNASRMDKSGKPSVIIANTIEDFLLGDIVITTYQKFISEIGLERLADICRRFSLVIVDEVHRANADSFLKVLAALHCKHKLGLTATVTRKDGMHILCEYVLGPVLYKIKIETLAPRVTFHESGLFPKKDYSNWVNYCRWLERNSDRTQLILDQVIRDIKAKRHIVIPCTFTSQIHDLVRLINLHYGRTIAAPFVGGGSKKEKAYREQVLDYARAGKIKVVVGTRSILSTGVNVPCWDTLYWINAMSNPPNWVQEYSRILTPMEGKQQPIIRMYLDGSSQTRGCLRSCLFKTEGDTPTLAKQAFISKEDWAIANLYIKGGKMNERPVKQLPEEAPVRVRPRSRKPTT